MAVRYVDDTGVFLLPRPSEADPHNISGAVQQLLGAWLEVDLTQASVAGWVPATDRSGRTGFVRLAALRAKPLLKVFYVDVGQGDATVVESEDGILVIDGGPSRGLRDWMLEHYADVIAEEGRLQIETIVVTHFDQDHYRGLTSLLKEPVVFVRRLFHNGLPRYAAGAGRPLGLGTVTSAGEITTDLTDLDRAVALSGQGLLATRFDEFVRAARDAHQAGRLGRIDRLFRRRLDQPAPRLTGFTHETRHIDVLGPVPTTDHGAVRLKVFADPHDAGASASSSHTINGNSVVLQLTYGHFRFLFGGDLNQPAQRYLLGRYGDPSVFSADVNKACHHGSADFDTSYLDSVGPQATVFSSGDNGTHDHPMPDAIGAAARHTDVAFPLIFSTELARETGSSGVKLGHINARCNGTKLVMAQRKEVATDKKTWHTFPVPYPGPFG